MLSIDGIIPEYIFHHVFFVHSYELLLSKIIFQVLKLHGILNVFLEFDDVLHFIAHYFWFVNVSLIIFYGSF